MEKKQSSKRRKKAKKKNDVKYESASLDAIYDFENA